jgi:hypothetical protein
VEVGCSQFAVGAGAAGHKVLDSDGDGSHAVVDDDDDDNRSDGNGSHPVVLYLSIFQKRSIV